jgi:hypothetical protein
MSQSKPGAGGQRKTVEEQPSDSGDVEYLGNAIHSLLVEAQGNDKREARWGLRYPFFRNVSIRTAAGTSYSAFSRDISASGIGLLHNMELPRCEVEISTTSGRGYSLKVRVQITRCQFCSEGWYTSGGQFLSQSSHDLQVLRNSLRPVLLEAREDDDRRDPSKTRYPCFRPAEIVLEGGSRHSAFVRDISVTGIGLLHDVELPTDQIEIHIATGRGYSVKIRTQITSCQPCGEGWYVSGGPFVSIPAMITAEDRAALPPTSKADRRKTRDDGRTQLKSDTVLRAIETLIPPAAE